MERRFAAAAAAAVGVPAAAADIAGALFDLPIYMISVLVFFPIFPSVLLTYLVLCIRLFFFFFLHHFYFPA